MISIFTNNILRKIWFFTGESVKGIDFFINFVFSPVESTKNMQGKGFEPSDSFETGCLIEPFYQCLILSPAPLAMLGYPCNKNYNIRN